MKKQKDQTKTSDMKAEVIDELREEIVEETQETQKTADTSDKLMDEPIDEVQVLKDKCEELSDKNLRLMAEFDNYRKRTLKERMDLIKTASEKVLKDMLPLVDDFERAIQATESTEDIAAVREGVDLIYTKFVAYLLQNGVKAIVTENEDFDTDLHEAVTTFPAPSEDLKGKIIECVSKGYTLNDKVIRFPKVVVGE